MREDNLNPMKDNSDPKKFSFLRMLMNNRGEVGGEGEGEDEGDGEGGEEGGAAAAVITPSWRDSLDPSIKDHPSLANFQTPADVAKSYVNAQQLIGKKGVPLPSKDANPTDEKGNSEWNTVYDTLGRPSDPKAYELPAIEGAPELPADVTDSYKAVAHKLGLLTNQVECLYKWNQENAVLAGQASQGEITQSLQKSEASMRKEYGKAFDSNIASARNLISSSKFGGGEKVAAALDRTGAGNDPDIIRWVVSLSKQFGEDGNIHMGETQSNILSPQEAKMEVEKLMADKKSAYWNPVDAKGNKEFSVAEHKAMVKRVADLNAMAFPQN